MMELPHGKSLILFDGYCHLCNRIVQFILKFDRKKMFLFAPLESDVGLFWKGKRQIPESVDSIILIEENCFLIKSDAALKIMKQLGGFFPVFLIFRLIPVRWRDWLYDLIARNRFRWFGRRESCMIPT
ncbi:MAG: DCC1-like thiol-disulfide oxidoreductase family protein, partial [Prolixibacteraceae bacterium]